MAMRYLADPDNPGELTAAQVRAKHGAYRSYLETVRHQMPPRALAFASAPWHYDADDHQCPHDAWVQSCVVSEKATGARSEVRNVEIVIVLLGAYHDGHLTLTYEGVTTYSLLAPVLKAPQARVGHGDWVVDEVRLSEARQVIHEIAFSSGARWTIECSDIRSDWQPVGGRA